MNQDVSCQNCGAPLNRDARDGVCPRCLLSQALEGLDTVESAEVSPATSAASALGEGPGTVIGRYTLVEKLGEGGCGVVYLARQEEPVHRLVALKILKLGMDTRELIARFEAERQALAMMDHPHIAQIFDAGATGEAEFEISNLKSEIPRGRPYFVMEWVRGMPITEYCHRHNLSVRQRLDLFGKVCQAIQHAHQKGIIHRDIKPSNVLVTLAEPGQPGSGGVPKVIDFGIAKALQGRLADRTLFTAFKQFLGTPAYMSPEQADLGVLDIDTRTDIYSLGVLLYELLTGQTPFDAKQLMAEGWEAMRRIIREVDPPKPSTRLRLAAPIAGELPCPPGMPQNTGGTAGSKSKIQNQKTKIPPDLDWIVMKCLEKDRSRRYETVNSLAMDLERHLRLEPVLASPPSRVYRLRKFVRRHQGPVLAGASMAAVIVLGGATSAWQWRVAVEARRGEEWQRRAAETNAWQRQEQLVRLDVANGTRALDNQDWFGALLWFAEALRQDTRGLPGSTNRSSMSLARASWPAQQTVAEQMHRYRIGALFHYAPRLLQLWSHRGTVRQALFSPDGRLALTTAYDRTARLWDVKTGAAGAVLAHGTNIAQVEFTADGRRVLTLDEAGEVRVWDVEAGRLAAPSIQAGYLIEQALISPDGRRVWTAGNPANTNLNRRASMTSLGGKNLVELCVWDTATGERVRAPFRVGQQGGFAWALSPDGKRLAASFGEGLLLWNLIEPSALHVKGEDESLATMLPGLQAEPGSANKEAHLPDVPSRPRTAFPWNEISYVACLAFSPDNRHLVVARSDGTARVLSLPEVQDSTPGPAPSAPSSAVVLVRPKERTGLVSGRSPQAAFIRAAAFSPDSRRVLLVDGEGVVRLWNARTGEAQGQLKANAGEHFAFSPDGRLALLSAQVWDLALDEPVSPRPLQVDLRCAAFSPDGGKVLTGGGDGTVRLWSLAGGHRAAMRLDEPDGESQPATVESLLDPNIPAWADRPQFQEDRWMRLAKFSPDGHRVVTLSGPQARVWDTATGKALTPYVSLDGTLEAAAFSPDGSRFVTAGYAMMRDWALARVWDARTGQSLTPIFQLTSSWLGYDVSFSPDGRWVIFGTDEETRVWDAGSGEPAGWPLKLEGTLRSLAFSPDMSVVAVCTRIASSPASQLHEGSFQTRLWHFDTGQPASPVWEETNEVTHMQFSPDGKWLLTRARTPLAPMTRQQRSYAYATKLWQAGTGRLVTSSLPSAFQVFDPSESQIVFSRDGRYLYLAAYGEPMVWDLLEEHALDVAAWRGLKLHPSDITSDLRRVLVCRGREVRIYDAMTAEPLTPALLQSQLMGKVQACFGPEGDMVLASGGDRAQVWPLPLESRSVEDLVLLVQLITGRQIDPFGNDVSRGILPDMAGAWADLSAKSPVVDSVLSDEMRVWRQRMAETSEKLGFWSAALLHLDQLVKENPGNETLRVRRARARDREALEELK